MTIFIIFVCWVYGNENFRVVVNINLEKNWLKLCLDFIKFNIFISKWEFYFVYYSEFYYLLEKKFFKFFLFFFRWFIFFLSSFVIGVRFLMVFWMIWICMDIVDSIVFFRRLNSLKYFYVLYFIRLMKIFFMDFIFIFCLWKYIF